MRDLDGEESLCTGILNCAGGVRCTRLSRSGRLSHSPRSSNPYVPKYYIGIEWLLEVKVRMSKMALWRNFHPMGMDVLTIPMELNVPGKALQIGANGGHNMEWMDGWTINAF